MLVWSVNQTRIELAVTLRQLCGPPPELLLAPESLEEPDSSYSVMAYVMRNFNLSIVRLFEKKKLKKPL